MTRILSSITSVTPPAENAVFEEFDSASMVISESVPPVELHPITSFPFGQTSIVEPVHSPEIMIQEPDTWSVSVIT